MNEYINKHTGEAVSVISTQIIVKEYNISKNGYEEIEYDLYEFFEKYELLKGE